MAHLQRGGVCTSPGGQCWRAIASELAPKGAWQSGVFDCGADWGTCCYGCFLLPCLYGSVADRMRGGGCGGPCVTYCLLSLLCLCSFAAKDNRRALRERFNLDAAPCGDCAVHCCLGPCAVCQEARELKKRNVLAYTPPATQFVATTAPTSQQAVRH